MTSYTIHSKTQSWYGQSIGILILDAAYPCVPGNVGNATTFDYPVMYQEVKGASIARLLTHRDPELVQPFIDAAQELERRGVRAITGACGFMALFQAEVAAAVNIPVFLSSLLQVPFVHRITGKRVGIITADARNLTDRHFAAVGIGADIPWSLGDMCAMPEFRSAILEEKGTLDSAVIQDELLTVARAMRDENPDIGSFLLECSDLPPYAAALHRETGLPVFDFISMIDHVQRAVRPRQYGSEL